MNDKEIEQLWHKINEINFDEDEYMEQLLLEDCYIWKKGETRSNIWKWFDENYSKGLYHLLYEIGKGVENVES